MATIPFIGACRPSTESGKNAKMTIKQFFQSYFCLTTRSMMSKLALIILIFASSGSAQSIRYVKPNSSSRDCPGEPCLDIHQYIIKQVKEYFTDGSTFIFLPGNHTLQTTANLSSVSNVTLRGESDPTIFLSYEIFCKNMTNLVIFGLKFLLALDANMPAWKIVHSFNVIINCSLFEGNPDLKTSGRPLQLIDSNVSISNSLFKWNAVGVIFVHNGTALLSNNNFTGNRAAGELNGISLDIQHVNDSEIIFKINFIESGTISESGGAIFTLQSTIILSCNIFTENSANGHGGAMFIQDSTVVMNGNVFEGNRALQDGGAIYASDSIIDINGSHIQHNKYSSNSLEVTEDTSSDTVCELYFKSNIAQEKGGAIFLHESCLMMNNSNSSINFVANSAESGGAISTSNSYILAVAGEMTFLGNNAQAFGGALSINNAEAFGSALNIIIDSQNSNKVALSAKFINNTAGICGGASDVVGNKIIFMDTVVTGSSDSAFCISGHLNFSGTTIFSKNSGEPGGAILVHSKSHVSFTGHTVFDGNSADSGGAIYVLDEVKLAFNMHISFSHNQARGNGGAIYAHNSANIIFHQSTAIYILHNSAENGGAVYLSGGTSMMLMEEVVLASSHNHASKYGGVIYYEYAPTTSQCKHKSQDDDCECLLLPYCAINFALD